MSIARMVTGLTRHLAALKRLPRAGWLQRGVASPESVADHSYGVALLALLAGDLVDGVDSARLLRLALLHDLGEALLTDLPASASALFGKEAKRDAERAALAAVLGKHPRAAEYLALWQEYAEGASREARLLKALDRVELLMQALSYERAGSRDLAEFWAGDELTEFPALAEAVAALRAARPAA